MAIEKSYCVICQDRTDWLESTSAWRCLGCGEMTRKRTYADAILALEELQEQWSQLEKHLSPEQNIIYEPRKNNIDKTLSRLLRQHN